MSLSLEEHLDLIGRFVSLIFLILMIMVAGAEALRILQGESDHWITLGQTIEFAVGSETGSAESGVFAFPAIAVFAGLFMVFYLITKVKKPRK